jgi:hypothetical protein
MPEKIRAGCARPTGGPVGEEIKEDENKEQKDTKQKEIHQMIQVGQKAPDFTAPAYHKGEFTNIQLSDYLGKWNLLCFYPGDFTFV